MKLADFEKEIQDMTERNGSIKLNLYDSDNDLEGIWATADADGMAKLHDDRSNGDKVTVYLLNTPVYIIVPWGTAVEAVTRGSQRPECRISDRKSWPKSIFERNNRYFDAIEKHHENLESRQ